MIIRDTPSDLEKFFMADGDLAFKLQQRGVQPMYMDDDVLYFRKNNKLLKTLKKLNIKL